MSSLDNTDICFQNAHGQTQLTLIDTKYSRFNMFMELYVHNTLFCEMYRRDINIVELCVWIMCSRNDIDCKAIITFYLNDKINILIIKDT